MKFIIFIQENTFENVICKVAAILSQPQCVKTILLLWLYDPIEISRDHFVYAPCQWATALKCSIISHWLGTYTKWSLDLYECEFLCSWDPKWRNTAYLMFCYITNYGRFANVEGYLYCLVCNIWGNMLLVWFIFMIKMILIHHCCLVFSVF